ncbi:MAG: IS110 family transposase [Solirubrobacteraceae bacterium]
MTGTMTWVGMDVHARSTHAAAISLMTGEIERMRFGPGVEAPVAWLAQLPGPVHACYEAGPTGFGLYRAAVATGIRMDVVAPGKTPRGPADRVKTDRKDAELLARLLLAGQLAAITVPPAGVEAGRELTRLHDACRRDLMTARHRISKMLCATAGSIPSRRPGSAITASGLLTSISRNRSASRSISTCSPASTR